MHATTVTLQHAVALHTLPPSQPCGIGRAGVIVVVVVVVVVRTETFNESDATRCE